jgi:hypothetical protein
VRPQYTNHSAGKLAALVVLTVCGLTAFTASVAKATDRFFNIFTGNWSVDGNWNPVGVPAAGDNANIISNFIGGAMVTYDYMDAPITLGTLTIDLTNGGASVTNTLLVSGNALSTNTEIVGENGHGKFTQSSGSNTATSLLVGHNSGSNGSYSLSGNGSLTAGGEGIGLTGTGAFTQSGGTHAVSNNLVLGEFGAGSGTYTLSNGSLVGGAEFVGFSGTGTFSQSGGTNRTSVLEIAEDSSYSQSGNGSAHR